MLAHGKGALDAQARSAARLAVLSRIQCVMCVVTEVSYRHARPRGRTARLWGRRLLRRARLWPKLPAPSQTSHVLSHSKSERMTGRKRRGCLSLSW